MNDSNTQDKANPSDVNMSQYTREFGLHFRSTPAFDIVDGKEVPRMVTKNGKSVRDTVKRPSVVVSLPIPDVDGIIAMAKEGGKGLNLLKEAMEAIVFSAARDIVDSDAAITSSDFPKDKVTWEFLASQDREDRRQRGISRETWAEFKNDYIQVIVAATEKPLEKVQKAAAFHLSKYQPVMSNKPVLRALENQLAIYIENSTNAENFEPIIMLLSEKLTAYQALDDIELVDSIV